MPLLLTFFQLLEQDVRLLIVTFLSNAPNSISWRQTLCDNTTEMLFHHRSPFMREVGILFPIIALNDSCDDDDESCLTLDGVLAGKINAFERIGCSLTRLRIHDNQI